MPLERLLCPIESNGEVCIDENSCTLSFICLLVACQQGSLLLATTLQFPEMKLLKLKQALLPDYKPNPLGL